MYDWIDMAVAGLPLAIAVVWGERLRLALPGLADALQSC